MSASRLPLQKPFGSLDFFVAQLMSMCYYLLEMPDRLQALAQQEVSG